MTLPSGNGSRCLFGVVLVGMLRIHLCIWVDAMQLSINPSPFVRFALSVLVARSGTLLSRVFIVACATSVLTFASGGACSC